MNWDQIVPSFIKLYYSTLVTQKNELYKFYASNATFYRPWMKFNKSIPIQRFQISQLISDNSTVSVRNFSYAPLGENVSVNVSGQIKVKEKVHCFLQNFVLVDVKGKVFIVSDLFNDLVEEDFIEVNNESSNTSPDQAQQPTTTTTTQQQQTQPQPQQQPQNNNRNYHKKRNRNKNNPFVYKPD